MNSTQLSSSWHTLNGDTNLTRVAQVRWMVWNYINNIFPLANLDPKLELKPFNWMSNPELLQQIPEQASPSRKLSELFWHSLPWNRVVAAVGPINVLEVGCGSGRQSQFLSKILGAAHARYHGIDQTSRPAWTMYADNSNKICFTECGAHEVAKYLTDVNLLVSQSFLEHLENDLAFFLNIQASVIKKDEPFLQIHLVPSAPCLFNYLIHGIRQYTPRTISKITKLFTDGTRCELYSLGGKRATRIHSHYITYPQILSSVDRRKTDTKKYSDELQQAIFEDQKCFVPKAAAFYALVIQSGFKEPIDFSGSV